MSSFAKIAKNDLIVFFSKIPDSVRVKICNSTIRIELAILTMDQTL